jgi:hypothetical protein
MGTAVRVTRGGLRAADLRAISNWVHLLKAEGIEGFKSRKNLGRRPFLSAAQKSD